MVKNVLRGTIYVNDLDIRIPPKEYIDLDTVGRNRAEGSAQLRLAFEEGYLQNIAKTEAPAGAGVAPPPGGIQPAATPAAAPSRAAPEVTGKLDELKKLLVGGAATAGIRKPVEELKAAVAQGLQNDAVMRQLADLKEALKRAPATAPAVDTAALTTAVSSGVRRVEHELAELRQTLQARPLTAAAPAGSAAPTVPAAAAAPAPAAPVPAAPVVDPKAVAAAVGEEIARVQRELAELRQALRERPAPAPAPPLPPPAPAVDPDVIASAVGAGVARELADLKKSLPAAAPPLTSEFAHMRTALVDDLRGVMKELAVRRAGAGAAAAPEGLSEAEIKLRILSLEEQERALNRNFSQTGRKESGTGDAADRADELANEM